MSLPPASAKVRVVTRGDDAASSLSANRGIRDACENGILRNVSVMVPGPFLQDAWDQLGHLQRPDAVAFGLHVCLTSEWDFPRWGPVAPVSSVPSLVLEDGCFPRTCAQLKGQATLPEMLAEAEAQLYAMRAVGFRPVYMDEHMGVGWVNGLAGELAKLAARENLIYRPALTPVSFGSGSIHNFDYATPFLEFLRSATVSQPQAQASPYLIVSHPAYDDEEMRGIRSASHAPGSIARDRVGQRLVYQRSDVREYFTHAASAIRYDEAHATTGAR